LEREREGGTRPPSGRIIRLRMRTVRTFAFASIVVLGSLVSRPALAGNAAAAEALFNRARTAMDAKDFDTACQRFAESNRLDPAVGTVLNLGVCEAKRGRVATAWELFRAAYEKLEPSDPRHDYAKSHADELEPRLPKLTLKLASGAPLNTTVQEGDASYSGAAFGVPLPIDPGKHVLVVAAPGHDPRTVEIELKEAAEEVLEISPGAPNAEATSAPAAATSGSRDDGAQPKGKNTRTLGWILGGVGVAGLGVGAVAGGMALGKKGVTDHECDSVTKVCSQTGRDAASEGRTLALVSTVGWVAGILGVGAGAYFILTSGPHGEKTAIVTQIGPQGTQVSFTKAF
jgi:hypothetical protein